MLLSKLINQLLAFFRKDRKSISLIAIAASRGYLNVIAFCRLIYVLPWLHHEVRVYNLEA